MTAGSILVIDDDRSIRHTIERALASVGHTVFTAADGGEGIRLFEEKDPDLVLLDLGLPDIQGLDVLDRIRAIRRDAPVVIVTAQTGVRSAVEAMKRGAFDYLAKPVENDYLRIVVRRILEMQKTASELDHFRQARMNEFGVDFVMSEQSAVRDILEMVKQVAGSDTTSVLIEGESGTGKELIAHILHKMSGLSEGPFLDINCASLPEQLLESELFGHEKGAFTDAHTQKKGLLELADGGTLFLDEVGEMSLTIQVKLLRVLEKMTFRRVGGVKDIEVRVRIVSATNRNLTEEVHAGRFREDLYYRLKVVPVRLPPLRERLSDIPLLAEHFLREFNGRFRRSFRGYTPGAMETLLRYPWPGNIRELRNVLERAILLGKGERIDTDDLHLEGGERESGECITDRLHDVLEGRSGMEGFPLEVSMQEIEEQLIRHFSEKTNWNQTLTSRLLHMNRDKLRYRMKQYGIQKPEPVRSF